MAKTKPLMHNPYSPDPETFGETMQNLGVTVERRGGVEEITGAKWASKPYQTRPLQAHENQGRLDGGAQLNDLNSIIARAKRAKLLEMENDQLRAEIEKLQAECRAYRQLVAQCQEDEINRRALEQAKKRAAAEGMMEPLPEREGKR